MASDTRAGAQHQHRLLPMRPPRFRRRRPRHQSQAAPRPGPRAQQPTTRPRVAEPLSLVQACLQRGQGRPPRAATIPASTALAAMVTTRFPPCRPADDPAPRSGVCVHDGRCCTRLLAAVRHPPRPVSGHARGRRGGRCRAVGDAVHALAASGRRRGHGSRPGDRAAGLPRGRADHAAPVRQDDARAGRAGASVQDLGPVPGAVLGPGPHSRPGEMGRRPCGRPGTVAVRRRVHRALPARRRGHPLAQRVASRHHRPGRESRPL
jgi:hypothetical protein